MKNKEAFAKTVTLELVRQLFDNGSLHGCEDCPYFTHVNLKDGYRNYCSYDNFNIDRASYRVETTSHNKKKYVRESFYPDELEYNKPKRCPLNKGK